ncbi:MAG: GGDEF domain-containing protein, partial [Alphaproteobacteria bacterium]|nr:GGDEF domain-containing protein [Alphaproteobacteria bacterium]
REHVLNQIIATIRNMVNPADMLQNALAATLEGIEATGGCIIQKIRHQNDGPGAEVKGQQGRLIPQAMMSALCRKAREMWSLPQGPRVQNLQIDDHQILMGLTRHHGIDNGAIFLIRDQTTAWHEDEVYLFDGITTHLGIAVEQVITHEELERLAFTDELTGLLNCRAFCREVEKRLHHQKRSRKAGALLYLDLDNFKNVNDSRGHAHGDLILQQLAQTIKDNIRVGDYAARLGGDEFAIWLDEISEKEALVKASNFVVAARGLSQLAAVDDPQLSLSIGIAICLADNRQSYDDLMKNADKALYQVKAAGKSACLVYDPQRRDGGQNA